MLWTAFLLGLAGSTHCVGMCGPLVLALPVVDGNAHTKNRLPALLYNLGRISTYVVLGSILGLVGQGMAIAGLQKWFALTFGIVFLLLGLWSFYRGVVPDPGRYTTKFLSPVKRLLSKLMRSNAVSVHYSIGLLNGLLPCGLVYLALAGALTSPNWLAGALFMGVFGLGTLPLMYMVAAYRHLLTGRFRQYLRRLMPLVYFLFAFLLITRGLNVDFPDQLSFLEAMKHPLMCH